MADVRWGIIGLGRFGEVHARALASLPGSKLAALCTRSEARLAEMAAAFGVKETYTDFRPLLGDSSIDVVSVVTHWQQHAEIVVAALKAGKHVLVEKPLAPTAQRREILDAAGRATGYLMVGHVCRFDPRIALAKQAIDAGQIGRIVSMHAKRNLPRAPGHVRLDKISPLMGDGIHDADLMMWFLGARADRVYARTVRVYNYRYPDLGWAMLEFGDRAVGVVETVWCLHESTPYPIEARLEISGTAGSLTIDCANTGLVVHDAGGSRHPDTHYWPTVHGLTVGALANELAYFADCIRRGEAPAVITPREAARAVAVMEAAEESSEQRKPLDFSTEW